ncbi:hypothetical protein ADUPG1_008685 [Aduncisulcus paluster]|uniref:Uncharacterized protein n=1 Tax=Aduncisulcus paluster TaxID=2918883 RepID=A0ABQ5KSU8_9EUKA|nr:hypothetical protein ADUPG1_008685 [Aduncisulcus paluster]
MDRPKTSGVSRKVAVSSPSTPSTPLFDKRFQSMKNQIQILGEKMAVIRDLPSATTINFEWKSVSTYFCDLATKLSSHNATLKSKLKALERRGKQTEHELELSKHVSFATVDFSRSDIHQLEKEVTSLLKEAGDIAKRCSLPFSKPTVLTSMPHDVDKKRSILLQAKMELLERIVALQRHVMGGSVVSLNSGRSTPMANTAVNSARSTDGTQVSVDVSTGATIVELRKQLDTLLMREKSISSQPLTRLHGLMTNIEAERAELQKQQEQETLKAIKREDERKRREEGGFLYEEGEEGEEEEDEEDDEEEQYGTVDYSRLHTQRQFKEGIRENNLKMSKLFNSDGQEFPAQSSTKASHLPSPTPRPFLPPSLSSSSLILLCLSLCNELVRCRSVLDHLVALKGPGLDRVDLTHFVGSRPSEMAEKGILSLALKPTHSHKLNEVIDYEEAVSIAKTISGGVDVAEEMRKKQMEMNIDGKVASPTIGQSQHDTERTQGEQSEGGPMSSRSTLETSRTEYDGDTTSTDQGDGISGVPSLIPTWDDPPVLSENPLNDLRLPQHPTLYQSERVRLCRERVQRAASEGMEREGMLKRKGWGIDGQGEKASVQGKLYDPDRSHEKLLNGFVHPPQTSTVLHPSELPTSPDFHDSHGNDRDVLQHITRHNLAVGMLHKVCDQVQRMQILIDSEKDINEIANTMLEMKRGIRLENGFETAQFQYPSTTTALGMSRQTTQVSGFRSIPSSSQQRLARESSRGEIVGSGSSIRGRGCIPRQSSARGGFNGHLVMTGESAMPPSVGSSLQGSARGSSKYESSPYSQESPRPTALRPITPQISRNANPHASGRRSMKTSSGRLLSSSRSNLGRGIAQTLPLGTRSQRMDSSQAMSPSATTGRAGTRYGTVMSSGPVPRLEGTKSIYDQLLDEEEDDPMCNRRLLARQVILLRYIRSLELKLQDAEHSLMTMTQELDTSSHDRMRLSRGIVQLSEALSRVIERGKEREQNLMKHSSSIQALGTMCCALVRSKAKDALIEHPVSEEDILADVLHQYSIRQSAALRVQSLWRGHRVRSRLGVRFDPELIGVDENSKPSSRPGSSAEVESSSSSGVSSSDLLNSLVECLRESEQDGSALAASLAVVRCNHIVPMCTSVKNELSEFGTELFTTIKRITTATNRFVNRRRVERGIQCIRKGFMRGIQVGTERTPLFSSSSSTTIESPEKEETKPKETSSKKDDKKKGKKKK